MIRLLTLCLLTLHVLGAAGYSQRIQQSPQQRQPHQDPIDARPGRLAANDRNWSHSPRDRDSKRIRGPKPLRNARELEALAEELFVLTLIVKPVDRKGILKRTSKILKQTQKVWDGLPNQAVTWTSTGQVDEKTGFEGLRPAYAAQELAELTHSVTIDVTSDIEKNDADLDRRNQILDTLQRINRLALVVAAGYEKKSAEAKESQHN